ncbi:MAG: GNAT family N-acetyltransferase [Algoriphagus sp.]|nr:GNAT family N-acetyltransferase [Algoriphagus sp.]
MNTETTDNIQLTITPLPFDSELFGYPVGKAEITENWNENKFLEEANKFQLVYIFSAEPLSMISAEIKEIETRIVFEKELTGNQDTDIGIKKFEGELNSDLESLAFQSGAFSRFKTDLRLNSGEFEKLYKLWIQNSCRAGEVLIADNSAGFVSCNLKENLAQIGLIAVGKDQRSKGWGKKLIHAAEGFSFSKGATKMRIGTQEANQPACSLYSKLGYEVVEKVRVWHYWKK